MRDTDGIKTIGFLRKEMMRPDQTIDNLIAKLKVFGLPMELGDAELVVYHKDEYVTPIAGMITGEELVESFSFSQEAPLIVMAKADEGLYCMSDAGGIDNIHTSPSVVSDANCDHKVTISTRDKGKERATIVEEPSVDHLDLPVENTDGRPPSGTGSNHSHLSESNS